MNLASPSGSQVIRDIPRAASGVAMLGAYGAHGIVIRRGAASGVAMLGASGARGIVIRRERLRALQLKLVKTEIKPGRV